MKTIYSSVLAFALKFGITNEKRQGDSVREEIKEYLDEVAGDNDPEALNEFADVVYSSVLLFMLKGYSERQIQEALDAVVKKNDAKEPKSYTLKHKD
jgi:phosphoribosyl-ATP pyrophosphohydrolase